MTAIKKFYVYDSATGSILRTGMCPSGDIQLQAQAQAGEVVCECDETTSHVHDDLHIVDLTTGKLNDKPQIIKTKPPAYIEQRAMAYPPIQDQLDAIWKSATFEKDSEAWKIQMKIMDIKAKFPKI